MRKVVCICVLFINFSELLCNLTDKPVKSETLPSGLKIDHMFIPDPEACEPKSKSGDMLTMHYTGTLQNGGKKFDSRYAIRRFVISNTYSRYVFFLSNF